MEDTNSPTSVGSQERLALIRKKKIFPREALVKRQNRKTHEPERTIPNVIGQILACNNGAPEKGRDSSRFLGTVLPWLIVELLGLYISESPLTRELCCGSNNVEGTNNPTSIVSQRRLVLIYEISFKE